MSRQLRVEGAGLVHHVTGHAIPTRRAFPDDLARRGFFTLLASAAHRLNWVVLAYCQLSTHYHLLVRTAAPNLGTGMQQIHGRHAQVLNARLGTSGPLWRGRFHSSVVETDAHVVRAAAYIDANPVDAGLCSDPAEWLWSSYRANAGLAPPRRWHKPGALHSFLGADADEAPRVYQEVVATAVERARWRRITA